MRKTIEKVKKDLQPHEKKDKKMKKEMKSKKKK